MIYFLENFVTRQLVLCYLFILCLALSVNTSAENMDSKILSAAVTKFSARFCNELEQDKSVVASPLSAEFVLALLALGATDDVHDELLASLGIPDDASIRDGFSKVSAKLKSIKGVTLNVANKVYIMEGPYDLNPTLKDDAVKVFDAGFEKLDFATGQAAANIINKWVEDKTNNRIKDLLSGDSLSSDTRLVLVNALYFKGTWSIQFPPSATRPRPFHIDEAKTIEVPMMYNEDTFSYGISDALEAQLLQMDYIGGEASMIVVLPNQITGLAKIMQKLAAGHDLMTDINKMHRTKVQVSIPKFKIETEIDLTQVLPKLGIKGIFDANNKGLRKILNVPEDLYVSTAVQKAFIEVNEEGAEAAAATGMVMMMRCAMMPSPPFIADRPFLYLLRSDQATAFIGVYRGQQAA